MDISITVSAKFLSLSCQKMSDRTTAWPLLLVSNLKEALEDGDHFWVYNC